MSRSETGTLPTPWQRYENLGVEARARRRILETELLGRRQVLLDERDRRPLGFEEQWPEDFRCVVQVA